MRYQCINALWCDAPWTLALQLDESVHLLDDLLHTRGLQAAVHTQVKLVAAAVVPVVQECLSGRLHVRGSVRDDRLESVALLHLQVVVRVDDLVEACPDVFGEMTMAELLEAGDVRIEVEVRRERRHCRAKE